MEFVATGCIEFVARGCWGGWGYVHLWLQPRQLVIPSRILQKKRVMSVISTILPEVQSMTTSPKHKQPMNAKFIFETIKSNSMIPTARTSQSTATIPSIATLKHKSPIKLKNSQTNQKALSTTLHVTFTLRTFTRSTTLSNKYALIHLLYHIVKKNSGSTGHYPKKANRDDYSHHLLNTLYIIVYTLYILTYIFTSTFTLYRFY